MIKVMRLVQPGGLVILASVDTKGKERTMDTVPIVHEFPDVFRKDLPGVPPFPAADFGIELEPRTRLLALAELKELKAQLQYILDKGFICPSLSHWGASMLFVK